MKKIPQSNWTRSFCYYVIIIVMLLATQDSLYGQSPCAPSRIIFTSVDFSDCEKPLGYVFASQGSGSGEWQYNATTTVDVAGTEYGPINACWATYGDFDATGNNVGLVTSPTFDVSGVEDLTLYLNLAYDNNETGNTEDSIYIWVENVDTGERYYRSNSGYLPYREGFRGSDDAGSLLDPLSSTLAAFLANNYNFRFGFEFNDGGGLSNNWGIQEFSLTAVEKPCDANYICIAKETFEPAGTFDGDYLNFAIGNWETGPQKIWQNSPGLPLENAWATFTDRESTAGDNGTLIVKSFSGYTDYNVSFFYEYDDRNGNQGDSIYLRVLNGSSSRFWNGTAWVNNQVKWYDEDRVGVFNQNLPVGFVNNVNDQIRVRIDYDDGGGLGNGFGIDNIRLCGLPTCTFSLDTVLVVNPTDCEDGPDNLGEVTVRLGPSAANPPYVVTLVGDNSFTSGQLLLDLSCNCVKFDAPAGEYNGVLVRSADDCVAQLYEPVSIDAPEPVAAISLNITSATCGLPNGQITTLVSLNAGNSSTDLTYQWSNGLSTSTIVGLAPDLYSLTLVHLPTSCTYEEEVNLVNQGNPVMGITFDAVDAAGCDNSGSVTVSATANGSPLSYLWNTGATTATISNLSSTSYSVDITSDDNGQTCTASDAVLIPAGIPIDVQNIIVSNVNCNGDSDGSAQIVVAGGNGNLSYLWSNGVTTPTINGLSAGNYTVTITDEKACTAIESISVNEPLSMLYTPNGSDVTCNGVDDGAVTISVNGGTGPYVFAWTMDGTPIAATNNSLSDLSPANYEFTITDVNGCTETGDYLISEPPLLTLDVVVNANVQCFGGMNGIATATGSGGNGGFAYNWSNGATDSAIAGLAAGAYTVSVTDSKNCTVATNFNISQPDELLATRLISPASCIGISDGFAGVDMTGGVLPYTYQWDTGETTSSISALLAGEFEIEVTDGNNCVFIDTLEVVNAGALRISSPIDSLDCNGDIDGIIVLEIDDGPGTYPYTYLWTNGATTANISGLAAGPYTVTVSYPSCVTPATFEVEEPTAIAIDFLDPGIRCGETFTAEANIAGGTPDYSYLWSNGEVGTSAEIPIDLGANTTYSLTITDANSCEKSATNTLQPSNQGPVVVDTTTKQLTFGQSEEIDFEDYFDYLNDYDYSLTLGASVTTSNSLSGTASGPLGSLFNYANVIPVGYALYEITPVLPPDVCPGESLTLQVEIYPADAIDLGLFIPEIFTPNSDGKNDVWQIKAPNGIYPTGSYEIFNRNGALVADSDNLDEAWDGNEVPDGVYWVLIEFEGKTYKGAITKLSE